QKLKYQVFAERKPVASFLPLRSSVLPMKTRVVPLLVFSGLLAFPVALRADSKDVKLTRLDDRVRVEIGGKLFTEYIFKGAPKPYLYPVLAADGTEMMRHYPM